MNEKIIEVFDEGVVLAKPKLGPKKLILELTTKCNLNCIMCFRKSWSEIEGEMNEKLFMKILDEAVKANTEFIWFGGWGEPLIHKNFIEFAEEVKRRGFKLGINTNGTLLNKDLALKLINIGLDRLSISIDAASQQTYNKIRGGNLNNILRVLKFIHEERKRRGTPYPITEFIFTAMNSNINELISLIELAEKYGIGRIIVSNVIPILSKVNDECLYLNDNFNFDELYGKIAIKSLETNVSVKLPEFTLKTERKCPFIMENAACITWNGNLTPCFNFLHTYKCYIYGVEKNINQIVFGNLNKDSLINIWNKVDYLRFRFKVRYFNFPSCTDCKFHDICDFTLSNEYDCWSNSPSCADCLYSRGIIQCPI